MVWNGHCKHKVGPSHGGALDKGEVFLSPDEIINSYKPMVEFIANICGKNCEVILHDLRQLESSIVAISNNHITERQVGGTITDFALQIIHDKEYETKAFIANYPGKVTGKDQMLRSSTFFIKDEDKNVIAMLCVNVDTTALKQAQMLIKDLLMEPEEQDPTGPEKELFTNSMEELLHNFITEAIHKYKLEVSRLMIDEKKQIVKDLNDKGVFLLKGAVSEVAQRLETSDQTIYRYLKEL
jgi:predicted transcriptional regulator YheO